MRQQNHAEENLRLERILQLLVLNMFHYLGEGTRSCEICKMGRSYRGSCIVCGLEDIVRNSSLTPHPYPESKELEF